MENTPETPHLVDAFHIDSPRLLVELTNAIPGGEELTMEKADELLHQKKYRIDEVNGKIIRVHFCGMIDPSGYNAEHGEGAVERIVDAIQNPIWERLPYC
ncbi:MAG: hypothetical protein WCT23_10310 [Candidatus Neomarinimicrobiota bacterium]|nr:hypothetical protein [Candidatus Paceibacterota bacterium]